MKILKDKPRIDFTETDNTKHDDDLTPIEFVEKHYTEMTNEFKTIQREQYELFCCKQYNYGKGNIMLGGDIDKKEDRKTYQ